MKFAFVDAERAWASVTMLCRTLKVSRSGFYDWLGRSPSVNDLDDMKLGVEVGAIFKESRETYGSPRVQRELKERGIDASRKRIARLMREMGLRSRRKRRFRATTDSKHKLPVAENVLDRNFNPSAPDTAWVTDITYVQTDEGWLYLAVILDLFSRRVVGLAMSERIDRALTLAALRDAVARRGPNVGFIHHSDRGSQYASNDYQAALDDAGAVCSMSRKANCWDNAVAESFFATIKTEMIYSCRFATRQQAKDAIFDFIETFYNSRRRHSAIGYLSPIDFENKFIEESRIKRYQQAA